MGRITGIILTVMLLLSASGCGRSNAVSEEGLSIAKDGAITATVIESFDKDFYDINGLEEMIRLETAEYNNEAGEQRVSLEQIELNDAGAAAVIRYESWEDYAAFNEVLFFAGTVKEAAQAGIDLNVTLTEAGKETTIGQEELTGMEAHHVVVWEEDIPLKVPSVIKYYGKNVRSVGSKKAAVQQETSGPYYLVYK